ncbi:MAG: hypothetical protein ACE5HU_02105 [Acidobacteriota bacterium]
MKRYLSKVLEYWLAFGHAIGVLVTPVQLFLVYSLVFGPARLFASLGRKDLLDRRMAPCPSYWKRKESYPHSIEAARHQF